MREKRKRYGMEDAEAVDHSLNQFGFRSPLKMEKKAVLEATKSKNYISNSRSLRFMVCP